MLVSRNILKLQGLMRIGHLCRRVDQLEQMKTLRTKEEMLPRPRITAVAPTDVKEVSVDGVTLVHLLKTGEIEMVVAITTTALTATSETDTPGREARLPAASDVRNVTPKKPSEDKNVMPSA